MNILFLDDMSSRRKAFQQAAIGCAVHFACDADEAIALLRNNVYDMIYLDHDLETEHYSEIANHHRNGQMVAKEIIALNISRTIIIVHSLNPIGRQNIKSILKDKHFVYLGPEDFRLNEIWKIDPKIVYKAIEHVLQR